MSFLDSSKMWIDTIWSILTAEPLLTIFLVVFFGGSVLLALIVNMIKQYRLKKSGILEVDKMTGKNFEEYLQVLFKSRGYHVKLTPTTGDYGADLILTSKGEKIVVQAKRYKNNVGIKAVQEVVSARSHFSADKCWVITNSYFTNPAKELAGSNSVELINRDQLLSWMLKMNKQ
ncbi:restriction system protein [Oceanobacillus limi]|uniref:Restriction system protein n=1 Tax=Oceanobacillus limi TaxID=930131 RepID=A0A1H9Y064_9BACI|nr:restriction endonuclease [Oceanobacillus limi]SES61986.1 restriction system protein [Oceanobacillus limi]